MWNDGIQKNTLRHETVVGRELESIIIIGNPSAHDDHPNQSYQPLD
jgi:hypothetical protein